MTPDPQFIPNSSDPQQQGRFSLGEMLRWAARRPSEVELVDGEFFFITALSADTADDEE